MMSAFLPEKKYHGLTLLEKMSENEYSDSWKAIDENSKKGYFLKRYNFKSNKSVIDFKSLIENSFKLQQKLKSNGFLTAVKSTEENGSISYVYPLKEKPQFCALTNSLFWKLFPKSLFQISSRIDLLHCLGLVHCDIKFENFIFDRKNENLILADFEFLSIANTQPNANLIGTPGYIAPEIQENNSILFQSDNYSLGIAIRNSVEDFASLTNPIRKLISMLTQKDPLKRPRFLGNVLTELGILNQIEYNEYCKGIISEHVKVNFRHHKNDMKENKLSFDNFVISKNKIQGIPIEFLNDISSASSLYIKSILNRVINKADISRIGDYWQLTFSDDLLNELYSSISTFKEYDVPDFTASYLNREVIEILERISRDISTSGNSLKAYLRLWHMWKFANINDDKANYAVLCRLLLLSIIADLNGRINISIEVITNILKSENLPEEFKHEIEYRLTYRYLLIGDIDNFEKLLNKALNNIPPEQAIYYSFKRLSIWHHKRIGRLDLARNTLAELLDHYSKENDPVKIAKIYHDLAIIDRTQGRVEEALCNYNKAIEYGQNRNATAIVVSSLGNKCNIYYDLSRYKDCINSAQHALSIIDKSGGSISSSSFLINLMLAYSRTANHNMADHYLHRYIEESNKGIFVFQSLYFYKGSLLLNKGHYYEATISLSQAASLIKDKERSRELAKVYQMLALVYFYKGEPETSKQYINFAQVIFNNITELQFIPELELIREMNNYYYEKHNNLSHIHSIFGKLLDNSSYYYAARALYILLLNSFVPDKAFENNNRQEFINTIFKEPVPLFRALRLILGNEKRSNWEWADLNSGILKGCIKILDDGGQHFLSSLTILKLADKYRSDGNFRISKKYYSHLAERFNNIGNSFFVTKVLDMIRNLEDVMIDRAHAIESVLSISNILQEIDKYEDAVENLIKYVVEETGAERGVLLIQNKNKSDEPRIEAYYNCDEESIGDISAISKNLPKSVFKNNEPLIIDDALENKLTSKYKSIIKYNVRSVICIPIDINEYIKAVLYLDHNIVPALFDKSDISYSFATANFLSIILKTLKKYRALKIYKSQIDEIEGKDKFITEDPTVLNLLSSLPKIARSNSDVLILGESGTGKELIARMIHKLSARSNYPLLTFNCAALSETLLEAELFGVDKGTVTGVDKIEGKFAAADGGTMFIDEIGNMPIKMQNKLLRAVEYQEYQKVASNITIYVDIRFLYATNQSLRDLVNSGKFRKDLYYRLDRISLEIPPLRDRIDDIKPLVSYFLNRKSDIERSEKPIIGDDIIKLLCNYDWPGNVRELKNLIERLQILYPGKVILPQHLPKEILASQAKTSHKKKREIDLKTEIHQALVENNWNQSAVSRKLEIPLTTLRRKIKKFNIK